MKNLLTSQKIKLKYFFLCCLIFVQILLPSHTLAQIADPTPIPDINFKFPALPKRFLPEDIKESKIIFINSEFVFALPLEFNPNEIFNQLQKPELKLNLIDSDSKEFTLSTEVIYPQVKSFPILIKSDKVPNTIKEGIATLILLINGQPVGKTDMFIVKTIAAREGIDESLGPQVESISVINRFNKDQALRRVRIIVAGTNIYKKTFTFNDKVISSKRDLTSLILFPQGQFPPILKKVLHGNQVIKGLFTVNNLKYTGETYVLIISNFGFNIQKVIIPICEKTCGES